VLTATGATVLEFDAPEGRRYGVLTTFVEGQQLRRRSSATSVQLFGRHVATIHLLADRLPGVPDRPANDAALLIDRSIAAAETALLDRPDVVTYLAKCANELRPIFDTLPRSLPDFGPIHGDVIRANALVSNDGSVTVLDFDFFGPGWRAYDIATYLLTIRGTPDEASFADAFLAGYNEVRPLPARELYTLPFFEAVRAVFDIGVPARYVDHWGSAYLYATLDQSLSKLQRSMDALAAP
jgi:Ser/Thr protein kinase RdoA (MazF antagonist)